MNVHSSSQIGKRQSNEDKHFIYLNQKGLDKTHASVDYYLLCDGHGSKAISKFLCDNMPKCFIDKRVEYPLKPEFVSKVYDYWNNVLTKDHFRVANRSGSTCLQVINFKKGNDQYLNVLNTGDCRAILCYDNEKVVQLTEDHKPFMPKEYKRITKLGGTIVLDGQDYRIKDLSVSRSFGDLDAQPYVTYKPDMKQLKLDGKQKFMVIACDGLWDVLPNEEVCRFINQYYRTNYNMIKNKKLNVAKRLADFAIERGSSDNVSVIIVFFK